MKKLYSIVLMAAALLIGTNAWATTVAKIGTTEYESFEAAWKAVKTGETIQLQANITIGTTLWLGTTTMEDANPLSITLDLNGDTLTSTAEKVFVLTHGSLNVTGNGGIKHAPTGTIYSGGEYLSKFEIFRVYGSTYKDIDAKTSDTYYTHLTIDAGVKLVAAVNGIVVDKFGSTKKSKPNEWPIASACAAGNKEIPTTDDAKFALYTDVYSSGNGVAHGVCIDVKGTIEARKYAIKANGNLRTPAMYPTTIGQESYRATQYSDRNNTRYVIAADDEKNYSPYIHIYNGARLLTTETTRTDAVAAYGGGYARWLVEGAVVGSTAVYVKSGEIDLKDAQITSNFDGVASGSTADRSSGVDAGGSGLVIESSANYAGGTEVKVEGNTVITPTTGYALEEKVTNAADTSKVENIDIQGGTFKEGEAGTIQITKETKDNEGKTTTSTIEISGGTIEGGNDGTQIGDKNLTQYLTEQATSGTTTHATVVEIDDEGNETIVISEGAAPNPTNSVIAAVDGSSINWNVTANAEETLTADKTLAELQISSADYIQKLTIADGVTLSVGRVVLGAKAQIVVKPGAKLVVTGEQGLAAYQESNLVLENANGKRSIFLFHPAVTSNTHPMATFEILSTSWRESASNAQSEVIGIPTHNAITSIACKDAGKYGYLQVYGQNGTWENIAFTDDNPFPYEKLNKPFAPFALTAYRAQSEAPLTFVFGGELYGNSNADLVANLKWSFFANSYSAELDLATFLAGLAANAQVVDAAVYISNVQPNGHWNWKPYDAEEINEAGSPSVLQPMQGFLLNNTGNVAESNAINYETMVYAPAVPGYVPSTPAPRRLAVVNNTAKMKVVVTDVEGSSDDVVLRETENTKAIEKYMNEDMNIYATAEKKNAIYAVENLEETVLGFSTVKGGNFTISFANVAGNEFMLIDHETGAQVLMVEGNTYEFAAAANSANDYRFEIVSPRKVTTAIENAEAVKSAKGIYTITGQYMGEMNVWNSLPAGVYVVNGEKRVK